MILLLSFEALFKGRFDNGAQVREQKALNVECHEHVHCSLEPLDEAQAVHVVNGPQAILASYYLDSTDLDSTNLFRLRIYRLTPRGEDRLMEVFRPRDVRLAHEMSPDVLDLEWDYIEGCDIVWGPRGDGFKGIMRTGRATIASQKDGRPVIIEDELDLSEDALWVNDRGYDAASGALLYGSRDGVPYKLQRL